MNILKMSNISKSFYGVGVLDRVDFDVKVGEVHALLGENGAGKSTLMNILSGVYQRDSGTIEFDGELLDVVNVHITEAKGIAFVHQELNLFNDLKVYENMFLRKELTNKLGFLKHKEMIEECNALFGRLGVDIDATELVENLETSKKQLLEIAKALHADAKLIILDEPTTALNNSEIEHLFEIVGELKKNGVSFIFISHKMDEIFTVADRYSVLRNGNLVGVGDISDITPLAITKLMVGDSYQDTDVHSSRPLGDVVLDINNLTATGFTNISMQVKRGEIIGVTGLKGAGTSEFLQCLFGVNPAIAGTIKLFGTDTKVNGIKKAMKSSVAMIAANRKENSILPDFDLLENSYIAEHSLSANKQFISKQREIDKFEQYKQMLNVKCNDASDMIVSLSGGNQQKVIIGRWLNTKADILLMDNPTQGIDVGAKAEIYKLILQLAEQGKTIIVNTLEIPEIMKIADRCAVFYQGEIKVILDHDDITEHEVMLYATNAIAMTGGNE